VERQRRVGRNGLGLLGRQGLVQARERVGLAVVGARLAALADQDPRGEDGAREQDGRTDGDL
jgi:hypothetical protein